MGGTAVEARHLDAEVLDTVNRASLSTIRAKPSDYTVLSPGA